MEMLGVLVTSLFHVEDTEQRLVSALNFCTLSVKHHLERHGSFAFHLSSSTVYSKHDAHLLSHCELKCRCELRCPGSEELLVLTQQPWNLLPEHPGEIL